MENEKSKNKPAVWVNVFTAKPGKLNKLVKVQTEELRRFAKNNKVKGWLGSRLHYSVDNNKAIMISTFESIEAHKNWTEKTDFSEHLSKVEHLIENVEGDYYTVAEEAFPFNRE